MSADQKSGLGLTDPATGRLVGNLSASDLRGLAAPEDFAALLAPAAEYQAVAAAAAGPLVTLTPAATFGQVGA